MITPKQIIDKVAGLWKYIRELEEYKWERGSSCCLPDPKSLDDNPFHFDGESKHPRHDHKPGQIVKESRE